MLKSSRYSVTFPTNGLSLTGEFTFQPGVTIVTGQNGKGKTFGITEVWRYLLFGKKALRGPASDYKNMTAEGVVEIKGQEYFIRRTPKGEALITNEETIAVGAEAVNNKIVEVLGFGLDVFDITNASVQKESNRLSKLTPAKRKELIDEVIGLSRNEELEKDCKAQAKIKKLEAETIRDNVPEPIKPILPIGYEQSSVLSIRIADAKQLISDRQELQRTIDRAALEPTEPSVVRPKIAELEEHETKRIQTAHRRLSIQSQLGLIPAAEYTAQQVDEATAVAEYEAEVARRGLKPEMALEEAKENLEKWQHKFALEKFGFTEVECPSCKEVFTPGKIDFELPPMMASYYAEQVNRNKAWATPLVRPKGEAIEMSELAKARIALERMLERQALLDELLTLPNYDDFSGQLAQARLDEQTWWAYDHAFEAWKEGAADVKKAELLLSSLPTPPPLPELEEKLIDAHIYEAAEQSFVGASAAYKGIMEKASVLLTDADSFTLGAKRLAEARREVKAHLAPSLSRIASSLIAEMTVGQLSEVVVDENMNIVVNGQDVATLSGAQETAANLALRLALGRTLVSGVFPVFIGDEIDADADEERSEATFECLKNLRTQFSQVIIITHKPHVTADHVIDFD